MNNCNNMRIVSPSGIWEYDQLIGAKVVVKSLSVSGNFFNMCTGGRDLFTIEEIYFRISLDGKTITVIKLRELPDKIFTWKDLEVVEINSEKKYRPICNTFLCGQAICGYKVDTSPSYIDELKGGIVVLDDKGNVINNRYVRFVGADVEDPTTDSNNITDISFNGDVLD